MPDIASPIVEMWPACQPTRWEILELRCGRRGGGAGISIGAQAGAASAPQGGEAYMSAAGTWTLALQTPIGDRKATVTFQVAGTTLTGRMTAEEGNTTDIYEGHLGTKTASWKANIKNPMPLTL